MWYMTWFKGLREKYSTWEWDVYWFLTLIITVAVHIVIKIIVIIVVVIVRRHIFTIGIAIVTVVSAFIIKNILRGNIHVA